MEVIFSDYFWGKYTALKPTVFHSILFIIVSSQNVKLKIGPRIDKPGKERKGI